MRGKRPRWRCRLARRDDSVWRSKSGCLIGWFPAASDLRNGIEEAVGLDPSDATRAPRVGLR